MTAFAYPQSSCSRVTDQALNRREGTELGVAPEVLSYQEALELALKEYQLMSREDLQTLLNLLQTDELMKPIE